MTVTQQKVQLSTVVKREHPEWPLAEQQWLVDQLMSKGITAQAYSADPWGYDNRIWQTTGTWEATPSYQQYVQPPATQTPQTPQTSTPTTIEEAVLAEHRDWTAEERAWHSQKLTALGLTPEQYLADPWVIDSQVWTQFGNYTPTGGTTGESYDIGDTWTDANGTEYQLMPTGDWTPLSATGTTAGPMDNITQIIDSIQNLEERRSYLEQWGVDTSGYNDGAINYAWTMRVRSRALEDPDGNPFTPRQGDTGVTSGTDYQQAQAAIDQANWQAEFNYRQAQDALDRQYQQAQLDLDRQQAAASNALQQQQIELQRQQMQQQYEQAAQELAFQRQQQTWTTYTDASGIWKKNQLGEIVRVGDVPAGEVQNLPESWAGWGKQWSQSQKYNPQTQRMDTVYGATPLGYEEALAQGQWANLPGNWLDVGLLNRTLPEGDQRYNTSVGAVVGNQVQNAPGFGSQYDLQAGQSANNITPQGWLQNWQSGYGANGTGGTGGGYLTRVPGMQAYGNWKSSDVDQMGGWLRSGLSGYPTEEDYWQKMARIASPSGGGTRVSYG